MSLLASPSLHLVLRNLPHRHTHPASASVAVAVAVAVAYRRMSTSVRLLTDAPRDSTTTHAPPLKSKNERTFDSAVHLINEFATRLEDSHPDSGRGPSLTNQSSTAPRLSSSPTPTPTPTPTTTSSVEEVAKAAEPEAADSDSSSSATLIPTHAFEYSPTTLPPRTDPLLSFLVNLLMKDGKKAQAERFVRLMLVHIAKLTNSDPLTLVYSAVEEARPLVKMSSRKQGGKNLQVPVPLTERQSTRKALVWIIEASKKRQERFIHTRLAMEFIAVVESNSNALNRKLEVHKVAMVNRANTSVRV